jgi:hypothetical protein
MAGAVAGRPIAVRFVDERALAKSIDKTKSMQCNAALRFL